MKWKSSIFPIVVCILLFCTFEGFAAPITDNQSVSNEETKKEKKVWEQEPLKLEVVLKRKYLDGNIETEVNRETVWSLRDFWANYKDWNLLQQKEGRVVFQKEVDDLSPAVKENGYIGLNENNVLSIFNGKPKDSEVIKAFYQIDVEKLESFRMDQLKSGIKVDKKSTFKNVMQTFKEYASTEPVDDLVDS
ncbi:BofC C-terminal domain-containing protein [Salinibacillus kushneri]|nr:BofC C-terminal domain-containing protein [Salinibacillus kushneri]